MIKNFKIWWDYIKLERGWREKKDKIKYVSCREIKDSDKLKCIGRVGGWKGGVLYLDFN